MTDLQPGERSSPPRMLSHHPVQGLSQAKVRLGDTSVLSAQWEGRENEGVTLYAARRSTTRRRHKTPGQAACRLRRLRILIGFPLPAPASSPSLALVVEVEESVDRTDKDSAPARPYSQHPSKPPRRSASLCIGPVPISRRPFAAFRSSLPLIDHRPSTPVLRSISARHVHVHPRLAHRDPRQHKPTQPASTKSHRRGRSSTHLPRAASTPIDARRATSAPGSTVTARGRSACARPASARRGTIVTARGTSTSTPAPPYRTRGPRRHRSPRATTKSTSTSMTLEPPVSWSIQPAPAPSQREAPRAASTPIDRHRRTSAAPGRDHHEVAIDACWIPTAPRPSSPRPYAGPPQRWSVNVDNPASLSCPALHTSASCACASHPRLLRLTSPALRLRTPAPPSPLRGTSVTCAHLTPRPAPHSHKMHKKMHRVMISILHQTPDQAHEDEYAVASWKQWIDPLRRPDLGRRPGAGVSGFVGRWEEGREGRGERASEWRVREGMGKGVGGYGASERVEGEEGKGREKNEWEGWSVSERRGNRKEDEEGRRNGVVRRTQRSSPHVPHLHLQVQLPHLSSASSSPALCTMHRRAPHHDGPLSLAPGASLRTTSAIVILATHHDVRARHHDVRARHHDVRARHHDVCARARVVPPPNSSSNSPPPRKSKKERNATLTSTIYLPLLEVQRRVHDANRAHAGWCDVSQLGIAGREARTHALLRIEEDEKKDVLLRKKTRTKVACRNLHLAPHALTSPVCGSSDARELELHVRHARQGLEDELVERLGGGEAQAHLGNDLAENRVPVCISVRFAGLYEARDYPRVFERLFLSSQQTADNDRSVVLRSSQDVKVQVARQSNFSILHCAIWTLHSETRGPHLQRARMRARTSQVVVQGSSRICAGILTCTESAESIAQEGAIRHARLRIPTSTIRHTAGGGAELHQEQDAEGPRAVVAHVEEEATEVRRGDVDFERRWRGRLDAGKIRSGKQAGDRSTLPIRHETTRLDASASPFHVQSPAGGDTSAVSSPSSSPHLTLFPSFLVNPSAPLPSHASSSSPSATPGLTAHETRRGNEAWMRAKDAAASA
ncbi:hypothetical protein B0H12DRAFT_1080306 [Mycena haematopus]|nr:hypothetical protein B0H12DRAFT_1080306 [Mycena haematopus]